MNKKKQYSEKDAKIEKKAVVLDYEIFDALADETDSVKAQTLYLFKDYDKFFCESGGQKNFDMSNLPADVRMAFKCKRINIERYGQKWLAAVERNRKNGAKGGRPRKTQTLIEEAEALLESSEESENAPETHKNPPGKIETHEAPKKPNQGLKGKGLKDSGCSCLKEIGEVNGEDCTSCVQLVEKFISGEIGIEFKQKLPACAPGCQRLSLALRKKPNADGSAAPTANSARKAPARATVSKF